MRAFSVFPRSIRFLVIAVVTACLIIGTGLELESQIASSDLVPQSVPSVSSSPTHISAPIRASQAPILVASSAPIAHDSILVAPLSVTPLQAMPSPQVKVAARAVQSSYGHLPYLEDDAARLEVVGQYARDGYARDERLDVEASQAFQQMANAAKASGILLMPLSGFRGVSVQAELFARQIERKGSKEAAARWSAPPGHSEHHTGYAIDIADKQNPESDLKLSFEATSAYRWLAANAIQYGFELSFPPNNWQGVSYEPWHWRYVGSTRATQVFVTARSVQ